MAHKTLNALDFTVKTLDGKCTIPSPLNLKNADGDDEYDYVKDGERILYDASTKSLEDYKKTGKMPISFEKAGPKEKIYFQPDKTKVAIVTAGGLCPGLNNVIKGLVTQLNQRYKVHNVVGIRYGFRGFTPGFDLVPLTSEIVDRIHLQGGSFLGSSRGEQPSEMIVDVLQRQNINILFCIGGDGTLRAAKSIAEEIKNRGLNIAVGCVPKTIDNDICFIDKSFGFETAFSVASEIVINAHNEAKGAYNGIAMIKLMGRDSGYIAANTALATGEANFVLIPEMKFDLYGPNGFITKLRERLEKRHHALIIVAEGAGQFLFEGDNVERDESGNVKYQDIGVFLKAKISEHFAKDKPTYLHHSIKYIDPSYIIRSSPANSNDSKFCNLLSLNAIHAAMAGKTEFVVGHWNGNFTILPISATVVERKRINLESELWGNVLEITGQPIKMIANPDESAQLDYIPPQSKPAPKGKKKEID
ncbi:MAG: ATP-dependent 6-phosphofructokinase [Bacteroidales bacterium]|nr:ATP-dependent 6-phosphofructokinase [Bacteroidales bacterium]